jgi:hypothetical protein
MNKIDEKALEHQTIPSKCINELREYCKDKFETTGGIAMFSTCINYGIMSGKRQERRKHEAEIELLKQENIQLKTILLELKNYIESL